MEGKKRERVENEEMNGKRGKGTPEAQTVTADEVDEFFAILRRMHVAVKYFEKGNNKDVVGRRKLTDTRWRPCFQAEDFSEEHNGVNSDRIITSSGGRRKEESGEENSDSCVLGGLDLNSDPASSPK